jgi:hypothetical protein
MTSSRPDLAHNRRTLEIALSWNFQAQADRE